MRYAHFGEGAYETTESAIRSLLAESEPRLGERAPDVEAETADPALRTPETYLGSLRAEGSWLNGPLPDGRADFGEPRGRPPLNGFAYSGEWLIDGEGATAGRDARIDATFKARRVFLVLGSADRDRARRVLLDGEPIAAGDAGDDVSDAVATVGEQTTLLAGRACRRRVGTR